PDALPISMLVFGVLGGVAGPKGRAAGRVVLGIAFVFLGIDQVKAGFDAVGGGFDPSVLPSGGASGVLLLVLAGVGATVVLQSSHASLMLILAAQAAGQLELGHALALAVGSNVGSSVSAGVAGALGGNRSGQRLALAHVLFNLVSAGLALTLLAPLTWLVVAASGLLGFGDNALLQLALFHTLFNVTGVAVFWPWQARLARWLQAWLPDRADPVLAPDAVVPAAAGVVRARYLSGQALDSADAAAAAVALDLPAEALSGPGPDEARLARAPREAADADALYRQRVKGVYADLLAFMGRVEAPMDEEHQRYWTAAQMAAMQAVEAVKGAKHLQKNMLARLAGPPSPQREAYLALRRHLFAQMRALHALDREPLDNGAR